MELNSTENGATETPSEKKSLDQVIAESKENILAGGDRRAGPGRKPKYHSDEARRAARNEQNRAWKAKRGGGQAEDATQANNAPEKSIVREVHPEPRPAGLAPLLDPLADMPILHLRAKFGLTVEEFPGIQPEAKQMLVAQADLTIGIFCPDAGNNKWVILGSLVATAGIIYAGAFAQAEDIHRQKKQKREETIIHNPNPLSMQFPTASV